MRAHVMGTFQLESDLGPVRLPTGKVRTLLEQLLVRPDAVHTHSSITAVLWPDSDPTDAATLRRLHTTVSRARTLLEDRRDAATETLAIVSVEGGYRLQACAASLDRIAFDEAGDAAMDGSGGTALTEQLIEEALSHWRGEPFTGFAMTPAVLAERERLHDRRRRLLDLRDQLHGDSSLEAKLLATKLHRPRIDAGTILRRPRLLDPLPGVGGAVLIAISAPAGYGKSVLLSQWAAEQSAPTAWLGLDRADGDVTRFWRMVMAAIDLSAPRHLDGFDRTVSPGSAPFLENLADRLGDAPGALGIVLDDLHAIDDEELLDQLASLVSVLPSTVTLAVASRDPLDVLVDAAGSGDRTRVVTNGDLRFDEVETERLVAATAPERGTASLHDARNADVARTPQALLHRTGGWPVAVASLLRTGHPNVSIAPERGVGLYLVDSVVRELPAAVRSFLVATAHLDRMHRDLCDAVSQRGDAGEMLAWLRRHDLFIVEAEADTSWYRYHDVVRDELRRYVELETDVDLSQLDLRASRWCLAHGLDEDALRYAIRGGHAEIVAELAGKVLLAAGLRGEARACRDWLTQLDPDHLATDPRSHAIAMFIAAVWLDVAPRGRWLRSRLQHFGGDDDVVLTYVRAVEAADQGRAGESVALTQRVLDEAWTYGHEIAGDLIRVVAGSALTNLVLARLLQGTLEHDDALLPNTVALLRPEAPLMAAWVHLYWALAALIGGDETLAASLTDEFAARTHQMVIDGTRAPTTIMAAVLHGSRTEDPARTRQLADQLLPAIATYERLGADTRATIARFAAADLYRRAGDPEQAAAHRGRAEVALRTFEDAPFVAAFRDVLDRRAEAPAPASPGGSDLPSEPLTAREVTVLQQVTTRRSMAEIAEALHISPHTVRSHTRAIYRKLGVNSRHEAMVRARELGLV